MALLYRPVHCLAKIAPETSQTTNSAYALIVHTMQVKKKHLSASEGEAGAYESISYKDYDVCLCRKILEPVTQFASQREVCQTT